MRKSVSIFGFFIFCISIVDGAKYSQHWTVQAHKKEIYAFWNQICNLLPCPICKPHAIKYMKSAPKDIFENQERFKMFLVDFHNSVNARTYKDTYKYDDSFYQNTNLDNCFKNFINAFAHNNALSRNFVDSYHRRQLVRKFIEWYKACIYKKQNIVSTEVPKTELKIDEKREIIEEND